LVSFPPPTKMLPFGGFPLREGALDSEESDEKSHSGILGSKAACAYPRRYRGLPRPSSALKPSHPPDGVALFGPMVVSVWRLVKHIILLCCASLLFAYAWCHCELLVTTSFLRAHFTLWLRIIFQVWSCIRNYYGITHIAELH
jgi:hypothetical protein